MPASQNFVLAKGKNASAAITKKRFVKLDTTDASGETVKQCDTLGEGAFGVSLFSVSSTEIPRGKGVSCFTEGRAIVEAATALAVGVEVTTDASGRAIAAGTGHRVLGVVDEPSGGTGQECSVALSIYSRTVHA
jgi:hypothetical protein